ncbi:hypothetical protein ACX1C1_19305 [Paenibacillus sp. strain BS8-2]
MTVDHAYVLTPRDVRNIRNYVGKKYASMTLDKRAEIVADAVSRVIHRQLPDFEASTQYKLTNKLIRTIVLEEQRPVRADDIYQVCMELDQQDEAVAIPLRRWLDEQVQRLDGTQQLSFRPNSSARHTSPVTSVSSAMPYEHVRRIKHRFFLYGLLCLLIVASTVIYAWTSSTSVLQGDRPSMLMPALQKEMPIEQAVSLNELPQDLKYTNVDVERLAIYLRERDSLLAESPYLDAIMHTAKEFDIHPALLFAITGQEQAFVPKTNKRAQEIANNPFNVFHSWKEFNTSIEQSSAIAARTINRLSKDRPAGFDPIEWINREYAEDPNWFKGVSSILRDIRAELSHASS